MASSCQGYVYEGGSMIFARYNSTLADAQVVCMQGTMPWYFDRAVPTYYSKLKTHGKIR